MVATIFGFKNVMLAKKNIAVTGLLFNTFSWYYLSRLTINMLANNFVGDGFESVYFGAAYVFSIIFSAILGAIFLKERQTPKVLKIWVIFGVLSSLLISVSTYLSFLGVLIISCLLGVSLGIAMPFCFNLFTKATIIENRGKMGGIALFATFFSVPLLYGSLSSMSSLFSGLSLALWRLWSLPLVFLISDFSIYENNNDVGKSQNFASVLGNRVFMLYFVAWLMFAFIDSFQAVVISATVNEFSFFVKVIEPCVAAFSAIVIGAVSDWIGRRRVLISGFVCLGVAYAVIGLFPYSWFSWLFYGVVDGIAIGSAWVLFTVILWGEISTGNSIKFYAIGAIPLFLAETSSLFFAPFLALVPQNSSFSLAAFFLFIAVVPLMFAPETLPEKTIRERELKSYVEKAKRVREKFT